MTAVKKKTRTRKLQLEIDDLEPTTAEQEWEEFSEEMGDSSSTVEVFRMVGAYPEQLDKVGFDDVRADPYLYLRQRFGAGTFRCKFKSSDGRYRGHKTFRVGVQAPTTTPGATGVNGSSSSHVEFLEKQQARQDTLIAGMLAAIKPQAPPDLGAMMTGLAAMMGVMMGAVPKQNPAEMFGTVAKIVTEMNPKGPAKDEDWIERVGKIVDLAKNLSPGSSDSVYGVIADVGKEVTRRLLPMPGETTQAAGAVETRVQIPATAEAGKSAMPAADDKAGWVRAGLAYLKEKARLNKDVETFLDLVFEAPEEPQWNAILGAVQNGATFEHLLQFDPEIGQNPQLQGWFKVFYDGVHAEIFKPVDTSGAGGDANNPPGNEKGSSA